MDFFSIHRDISFQSERLKDTEPSTSKESPSKSPKNKKIKKEAKLVCDLLEPRLEKTGFLHMRKQRRRSASR